MRMLRLVVACTIALGTIQAPLAQPKVSLKVANELSTFSRQTSVGTNNHRVKVERYPLAADRFEKLISEPALRGATACPDGYELMIENGAVRDFVGNTNSRLDGIGLYISLPDSGVSSQGNWYVAPVVVLRVTLRDLRGKDLAQTTINEFDRVPVRDSTFQEFLTIQAAELEKAIGEYASKKIEASVRTLSEKYCR